MGDRLRFLLVFHFRSPENVVCPLFPMHAVRRGARRVRPVPDLPGYWGVLREILETGRVVGPRIHDARIAALCRVHGVRELWTADLVTLAAFPPFSVAIHWLNSS